MRNGDSPDAVSIRILRWMDAVNRPLYAKVYSGCGWGVLPSPLRGEG
ncbi:hypothetical protein [Azospirillum argentinense]